jgi:hypothetical protein
MRGQACFRVRTFVRSRRRRRPLSGGTHHTLLSNPGILAQLHDRAASLIGVARIAGGGTDQDGLVRHERQVRGVGGG